MLTKRSWRRSALSIGICPARNFLSAAAAQALSVADAQAKDLAGVVASQPTTTFLTVPSAWSCVAQLDTSKAQPRNSAAISLRIGRILFERIGRGTGLVEDTDRHQWRNHSVDRVYVGRNLVVRRKHPLRFSDAQSAYYRNTQKNEGATIFEKPLFHVKSSLDSKSNQKEKS